MPKAGRDLKGRSSMSAKKPVPGAIWLFAGLAIGLFIAFLVYLKKQPTEQVSFTDAVVHELDKVKQAKKPQDAPHQGDKKDKAVKQPRFDFYTILPELEVFIPESDIEKSGRSPSPPAGNIASESADKQYLLQAGSFRNREDADRLKANLALLGVQSSIQSVSINSDTWHRVRIGPFSDTKRLQETLSVLKNNKIHAMTMELKN